MMPTKRAGVEIIIFASLVILGGVIQLMMTSGNYSMILGEFTGPMALSVIVGTTAIAVIVVISLMWLWNKKNH